MQWVLWAFEDILGPALWGVKTELMGQGHAISNCTGSSTPDGIAPGNKWDLPKAERKRPPLCGRLCMTLEIIKGFPELQNCHWSTQGQRICHHAAPCMQAKPAFLHVCLAWFSLLTEPMTSETQSLVCSFPKWMFLQWTKNWCQILSCSLPATQQQRHRNDAYVHLATQKHMNSHAFLHA